MVILMWIPEFIWLLLLVRQSKVEVKRLHVQRGDTE